MKDGFSSAHSAEVEMWLDTDMTPHAWDVWATSPDKITLRPGVVVELAVRIDEDLSFTKVEIEEIKYRKVSDG